MTEITIKTAFNGYILINGEETILIEDKDDEKQAFIDLVMELSEQLGFSYDKFKDDNLEVSFSRKGHKLD